MSLSGNYALGWPANTMRKRGARSREGPQERARRVECQAAGLAAQPALELAA